MLDNGRGKLYDVMVTEVCSFLFLKDARFADKTASFCDKIRNSQRGGLLYLSETDMSERKPLSKRERFEIFKRDQFTCQYCGCQPPDVVLHVDHINPVANGGGNETMNLVTACESCNQGKAAKLLENVPNRPDANLEILEMHQEVAELKRYQDVKKIRDELTKEIIDSLQELWWQIVSSEDTPNDKVFINWLTFATPNQIEDAIKITSGKDHINYFPYQVKYCSGILRHMTGTNRSEDGEG